MEWTREQQNIINARGSNLLVSAAAGSGKTAVLVEHMIRRIMDETDPVSVDRLMVMTFTRAAAEEMRERISAALSARIRADKNNRYLKLQKAMLPRAKISTIDSICKNLLKQNYQALSLDPNFRAADKGELSLLKNDVLTELLEERYETADERFLRFVEVYGGKRSDENLRKLIEQAHRYSEATPWPKRYLKERQAEAEAECFVTAEELSGLSWMQWLFSDIHGRMADYLKLFAKAKEICTEEGGPFPYLEGVEERRGCAERLSCINTYGALYAYLQAFSFSNLKQVRGDKYDPEKKEEVMGLCSEFKDYVNILQQDVAALSEEALLRTVRNTAPYLLELWSLTEDFTLRYEAKKRERNVVDFSDLEHLLLELLYKEEDGEMRPSELADTLAKHYAEILVDEYQDSNMVQEALVEALSAERFGRPDVFMVGDVKQSIYRFRLARPELFTEKYEHYESFSGNADGTAAKEEHETAETAAAAGARSETVHEATACGAVPVSCGRKIELNRNFRSRAEILSSINDIFFKTMQRQVGGVDYTEEAALYPGAQYGLPDEPQDYRTELLLLDENGPGAAETEEADAGEPGARLIADCIESLVKPGGDKKPFMVADKQTGGFRPAQYRDIVVLQRAPGKMAEGLIDTLQSYGIPAYTENDSGYFSAAEVQTMLAYLNIIDNPHQDIPLCAVLRSAAGGFSDEMLADMRASYDRAVNGTNPQCADFYEVLKFAAAGAETEHTGVSKQSLHNIAQSALAGAFSDALFPAGRTAEGPVYPPALICKKASEFLSKLTRFRELADFMPVYELLLRIYRETGYYDYVSAMPLGVQRRKNLDMLLERARSYAETSYSGIFHFVRYIESIQKFETDYGEASAVSEQDDIVLITSIHKSKGLEYPIVIVDGISRGFNREDQKKEFFFDSELGAGADYVDLETRIEYTGLKKEILGQKLAADSYGEELRLLYVAMTRAKEKLILAGTIKDAEKTLSKWRTFEVFSEGKEPLPKNVLMNAKSYLDFILMSGAQKGPNINLRVLLPAELRARETGKRSEQERQYEKLRSISPNEVIDASFERELAELLRAEYAYEEDTALPPLKTVSEIKAEKEIAENGQAEHSDRSVFGNVSERVETGAAGCGNPAGQADFAEAEYDYDDSAFDEVEFLKEPEDKQAGTKRKKGGARRGSAYHRVFELLPFSEKTDAETLLKSLAASGRLHEAEAKLVDAADIERFLAGTLYTRMAEADRAGKLFREQRFMIGKPAKELSAGVQSESLQLLQGIVDAYIENEDGTLTLIDYKTDRFFGMEEAEAEEALKERYRLQLTLYADALSQLTGKAVRERLIYSTWLGRTLKV